MFKNKQDDWPAFMDRRTTDSLAARTSKRSLTATAAGHSANVVACPAAWSAGA